MTREHRGRTSYHAGLAAEACAVRHYESRGLTVVAERWRGTGGEIDLILRDGAALVFVEVKRSRDFAAAAQHLTRRQMARLIATASEFMSAEPAGLLTEARFDVALVDGTGRVEVIENAFGD